MRNLTADDVFFFADGQNEDGCESQKVPSKEAHGWYFGRITKCYPKDDGRVEWRV